MTGCKGRPTNDALYAGWPIKCSAGRQRDAAKSRNVSCGSTSLPGTHYTLVAITRNYENVAMSNASCCARLGAVVNMSQRQSLSVANHADKNTRSPHRNPCTR